MAQGSYEPSVSKILTRILQKGDIFVDIGANIGYYSRLASETVGTNGSVYTIEADIENYYALSFNTKFYSNIYNSHFAISDNNGFTNINHSTHATCHSLVNTDNYLDGTKFTVSTITFDFFWIYFLDKNKINVLKVDVEGSEIMVLKGMKKLLSEKKIETLIIEFCPKILINAGFNETEFYQKIASNFSIQIIDQEYRSLSKDGKINSLAEFKNLSNKLLKEENAVSINLLCES